MLPMHSVPLETIYSRYNTVGDGSWLKLVAVVIDSAAHTVRVRKQSTILFQSVLLLRSVL